MILLNTCSTGKIQLLDSEPLLFFSLCVLNPTEDTELRLMDKVLVDDDSKLSARLSVCVDWRGSYTRRAY